MHAMTKAANTCTFQSLNWALRVEEAWCTVARLARYLHHNAQKSILVTTVLPP